jgi:TraX protein
MVIVCYLYNLFLDIKLENHASPVGNVGRAHAYPVFHIDAAGISFLKWAALLLMVADHINKYLLVGSQAWMFNAGRISMPLFLFVLGYNLARHGALEQGGYRRTALRLFAFGTLAAPAHAALGAVAGGWWPLNMMFTLLVAVVVAWLLDKGGRWPTIGACLVFVWGGALGEYWWPAVAGGLYVWAYFRKPGLGLLVGFVACVVALQLINGNFWALAALPVIAAARAWRWPLPRMKWFFYAFYPAHLSAIWIYLRVMA